MSNGVADVGQRHENRKDRKYGRTACITLESAGQIPGRSDHRGGYSSLLSVRAVLIPSSIEHARFHDSTNAHHHRLVLFRIVNYSLRSSLKQ